MSTDLATLFLKVDSTQVKDGAKDLDGLTSAGKRAEAQAGKIRASHAMAAKNVAGLARAFGDSGRVANSASAQAARLVDQTMGLGRATGLARHHVQNLGFQVSDLAVQLASGANPMMAFAQQGSQIAGIMGQAQIGVVGLTAALGRMMLPWVPLAAAIGSAYGAFKLFQSEVEDDAGLKAYANSLGLTKKEMKELEGVSITAGDAFAGLWRTIADRTGVDQSIADFKTFTVQQFAESVDGAGRAMATMYGETVGTYRAMTAIWNNLPAMFSNVFAKAANAATAALESLINRSVAALNQLAANANDMLGFKVFGQMAAVELGRVKETTAATFGDVRSIIRGEIGAATAEAQAAIGKFVRDVKSNTAGAARDRILGDARRIIGDRSDQGGGGNAVRKMREELSEAEKAYRAALKAAQDFQNAISQETDRLGLNAVMQKRLEVATAAAAARKAAAVAPTKAQAEALLAEAAAIMQLGAAWETVFKNDQTQQFVKNMIEPLELENSLIGLNIVAQRTLRAEHELTAAGIQRGTDVWNRYIDAVRGAAEHEAKVKSPLEEWADQFKPEALIRSMQEIQVRGLDGLSSAITDVITGTQSLKSAFKDLARSIIADIVQMTVRMLIFRAVSSAFPGLFGGSPTGIWETGAIGANPTGGAVAMAGGGAFEIMGRGGTDKNLLSLNGQPLARVSKGETGLIMPKGQRGSANSNAPQQIELIIHSGPSDDAWVKVENISARTVGQAAPVIVKAAQDSIVRSLNRPRLNG